MLIGISGCSASGKSTLAGLLAGKLSELRVCTVSGDAFFRDPKPVRANPYTGALYEDFNSPATLDMEAMIEHIDKNPSGSDIIIAEGVLLFCFPEFRRKADLLIYVDAGIEVRMARRLIRNTREYGMDFDGVLDYYLNAARFSEKSHTEPSKMFAHITVNAELDLEKPAEVIAAYIKSRQGRKNNKGDL